MIAKNGTGIQNREVSTCVLEDGSRGRGAPSEIISEFVIDKNGKWSICQCDSIEVTDVTGMFPL